MPDFERIKDSLREFLAPDDVIRAWARGYKAGKTRARYEVLTVIVTLYFVIALIRHLASV